jgi:hypothetical protein
MERTDWAGLPGPVRVAITARTGPVLSAQTVGAGLNSAVAIFLRTTLGAVFVKVCAQIIPGWLLRAASR